MANDLDELKHEVEELKHLTQDTNRQVHKMRRGVWWGRVWSIVWWLTIFGVSSAAYYYYAQPYVEKIQQAYSGFQQNAQKAQGLESQVQQFFAQYFGHSTTTRP